MSDIKQLSCQVVFLNLAHQKGKTSCLSNSTPKTGLQNGGEQWEVLHFLQQALDKDRQVCFRNTFLVKQPVTKSRINN